MSRALTAAALSAFVFPGIGHFYVKRHVVGTILAGGAAVSLYLLFSGVVERALPIAEKIQRGEVQLDISAIADLLAKQPTGADAKLMQIAWVLLIVAWLIGIVDSFRVGRIQAGN